ncbi:MAG TPA: hypothetical protein VFJ80_10350 [Candidatus Limnocylindrales bacterium]|jgi:hypothetical protein|nr:hypothetical protein [Candidatus Limnocylindrales bacterium]
MESNSPAEELPALYRAILDQVAEMEASGERGAAATLRAAATAAYSRAWDERARRRLESLLRGATRPGSRTGDPVRRPLARPGLAHKLPAASRPPLAARER